MTRQPYVLTDEKRAEITAAIAAYGKMSKVELIALVKQNCRVISIDKHFGKRDAISKMLEIKFGRRALDAY
jgi:hypothetical protein